MKLNQAPIKTSTPPRSVLSQTTEKKMQHVAVGTLSSQDSRNDANELESKGVDTWRSKDDTKSIDFAQESIVGTSFENAPVVSNITTKPPIVGINIGMLKLAQGIKQFDTNANAQLP